MAKRDAIEEMAQFLWANPTKRAIRAALIGERERAIEDAAKAADERGGYTAAEIAAAIRRLALSQEKNDDRD